MPLSKSRHAMLGLAVIAFGLASSATAHANEHIMIGSLKAANVGPAFVAKDKGYFAAEGLDVDFTYFESAQPVAVGVAAGSLDFGCTSTSAGMYALAGQGILKIISGMYSEAPGFHNFGIMASLKASAAGLKRYQDLPGHSVAISQVGSPVHSRAGRREISSRFEKHDDRAAARRAADCLSDPGQSGRCVGDDRHRDEPDAARSSCCAGRPGR